MIETTGSIALLAASADRGAMIAANFILSTGFTRCGLAITATWSHFSRIRRLLMRESLWKDCGRRGGKSFPVFGARSSEFNYYPVLITIATVVQNTL